MHNRTIHIAAAAVIAVAALALGVEVLRPKTQGQPSAFSAQLQANTALDLDPKAAIPLRQVQPGDFDVTWDAENGGTLRIMPGSSLRLLAPTWPDAKWDDVVGWAHRKLEDVRQSDATSVSARDGRFAAILTSEGNLAIVQIGDYDADGAQLRWQVGSTEVPGYGPAQVVALACLDPDNPSGQPCAIDFDTGQTFAIPARVLKLAPEDFMLWLEQNGVDAIARTIDGGAGLSGVGLACQGISPGVWTVVPALAACDYMSRFPYQSRDPILFQEDQYQIVYGFKTREGAIGILQLRGADRAAGTVQFRFRLVQPGVPVGTEGQAQEADESLPLYVSARWLSNLGRSVLIYANDHEDRLPQSLEELRGFAESDDEYRWMLKDVEYLGAGLTCADPISTVVAYDRTLLTAGKGTNVLFLDTHIEYVEPDRLAELGLPAGVEAQVPQDAQYTSAHWMSRLGRSVLIYASQNEDRFPPSLAALREFADNEEHYQWMLKDVEYLGAGLTCADPITTVVAYDRTLLAAGKGTNVLFLDTHIEFVEPERLAELGRSTGPQDASSPAGQ